MRDMSGVAMKHWGRLTVSNRTTVSRADLAAVPVV